MSDFVNTIDLLGDDATAAAIFEDTLTEFNDDRLLEVHNYAFYERSMLESVDLPKATKLGNYSFKGCSKLVNVNIPNVTSLGSECFRDCASLTTMDMKVPSIPGSNYGGAFTNCRALSVLILRSEMLCTLSNTYSLSNSYFDFDDSRLGKLLVPRALVEEYKVATNWSSVYAKNNRFLPLEDYTLDGTVTGEIDWDKLNAVE